MCVGAIKKIEKKLFEIGKDKFKLTCLCLNVFYSVCGLLLIFASLWYQHNHNTLDAHYTVQTFTAALGLILIPVAIFGIVTHLVAKAEKLFFLYMIVLGIMFIMFTSLSAMCLASNSSDLVPLLVRKWESGSNDTKLEVQHQLHCCGFDNPNLGSGDPSGMGHPPCWQMTCCSEVEKEKSVPCCTGQSAAPAVTCPCMTCVMPLEHNFSHLVKLSGAMGIVTALFMLFGLVYMAVHFIQENRRIILELQETDPSPTEPPAVSYDRF